MGHPEPVHALFGVGHEQSATPVQAARLAGNPFQFVVELNGVSLQLGDVGVAVQGKEPACGMPRRTGCQL